MRTLLETGNSGVQKDARNVSLASRLRSLLGDYGFLFGFLVAVLVAASITGLFFTQRNITSLFRQLVTTGFLSLGMLIVIRTAGIDLSVGSVVAFSGLLAAGLQKYMYFPWAMAVGVVAGIACGFVNGTVIARFKLQPFIVTLATMSIIRGALYIYSDVPQYPVYEEFRKLIGGGSLFNAIPVTVIVLVAFIPLVWFFLNNTTWGRTICAIGGNEEAVRLAGINVNRHIILAYSISGFFAAVGGVLLASKLGISQPSVGSGYELDAIAAVVIGGGLMSGGAGTVAGTCGGILALGIIDNLLNLYGVGTYYQQILKGIVILLAVMTRRRK
jgi:ribose/xylose/arabinose/galactoside ABC-type transport system permease subunit